MSEPSGKETPGPNKTKELAGLEDSHIVAAYARWAPIYDRVFGSFTTRGRKMAVAAVNALPPGRILEVGVGTGISLPEYEDKHRIVGIDLSPDMLALAQKRVEAETLDHVEAIAEMDASDLTFDDGSFDAAVAMFVMTVVPDPDTVLDEIARVVKPGGRVILVNHFSVDKGPRAVIERWMARFSARLGWRPNFPIERVLGHPGLKLLRRERAQTFELFTLLEFERV